MQQLELVKFQHRAK